MTTLSKRSPLPVVAAIAAAIAVGGAVVVRFLLKYLRRLGELKKRREARLALANATRPRDAPSPKVLYTVLVAAPALLEGSEPRRRLDAAAAKMASTTPGAAGAAFLTYGSKAMGKQALLAFLGKPDLSLFMTHCMVLVGEDPMAVKMMLNSPAHLGDCYAAAGPFVKGVLEMVVDLGIDLDPAGKEDPVLQLVFLRFKAEVTDDSDVYKTFLAAVAELGKCPGVQACLRPAGYHTMIKEDLLAEIQWKADSLTGSHCLTIAADSPQHLKDLQNSEAYGSWLKTEMPHLVQDGTPPAVVFFAPLTVAATS